MSLPIERGAGERFSDSLAFDFADPRSGIFGLARIGLLPGSGRATATAMLFDHGEAVVATVQGGIQLEAPGAWEEIRAGGVAITDDGSSARVAFEGEEASFELRCEPLGPRASFDAGTEAGAAAGAVHELGACRVTGEVVHGGGRARLDCGGSRIRSWGEVDWQRLAAVRSLVVVFEDGGLLGLSGVRPSGAGGHGEEALTAFLVEPDGPPLRMAEVLLTTQYDEGGRHRRAGLELYTDPEAPPLRAAGTLVCGTSLELDSLSLHTAFFSWALEGRPGLGRYDVAWRNG